VVGEEVVEHRLGIEAGRGCHALFDGVQQGGTGEQGAIIRLHQTKLALGHMDLLDQPIARIRRAGDHHFTPLRLCFT
jgi:hypothetical protein